MFPGMAGLGKGEHMFPVGEELAVWMENEEGMNHAGACGADLLCAKNLDTPYLISSIIFSIYLFTINTLKTKENRTNYNYNNIIKLEKINYHFNYIKYPVSIQIFPIVS